jgi:hypothetical protein
MPTGWVRFHMLRGLADDHEIVTFGFFDDVVIANGAYEIVETWTTDAATGGTGR